MVSLGHGELGHLKGIQVETYSGHHQFVMSWGLGK